MHLLFVLFDFTIVFALLGTTMLHHFATASCLSGDVLSLGGYENFLKFHTFPAKFP